ncbi:MAG: hypothetical protein HZY75_13925 [Nocardioidaceae bacterium]|nr:MAG: hypothetical protein HZY75_13925 [Nocardioidaceae bacterium]
MRFSRNARPMDERGQVSVLVIGFFLLAVTLVVVVVNASAAYLRHDGLANLADAAALAAADGVKAEQAYRGDIDSDQIDLQVASRYAGAYLEQVGASRHYPGVQVQVGASGDR